jgi:hypothetical protein
MFMLVIIHRAYMFWNYFLASFILTEIMVVCTTNPPYILLTLSSNASQIADSQFAESQIADSQFAESQIAESN